MFPLRAFYFDSATCLLSLGISEPPVFKGDYHPIRTEPLGGNAMLNCEVRGDPPPTIQWSKKGMDVQISNRIQQLNNGSLAIYGTVVSHWTVRMCLCIAVN